MTATTETNLQSARRLYQRACVLQEGARARAIPKTELKSGIRRVLEQVESLGGAAAPGEPANRSFQHWARFLTEGQFNTASVHLARAGLALGVRASQMESEAPRSTPTPVRPPTRPAFERVERDEDEDEDEDEEEEELEEEDEAEEEEEQAEAEEADAEPEATPPARPSKPRREPQARAATPRPQPRTPQQPGQGPDGLSPEEQALLERLPPAAEPLEGAAALAECWGGTMNPTSARGRYSRLATKLRSLTGRDQLLVGKGRYARLQA